MNQYYGRKLTSEERKRDEDIFKSLTSHSRRSEEFYNTLIPEREKSVFLHNGITVSVKEIVSLSDYEYEQFEESNWSINMSMPISNLTAAIINEKNQSYNPSIYNYPRNFCVSSLYLLAMRSAYFAEDQSSLYDIFKNAENLIEDILEESNTNEEARIENGNTLHTKGKFNYYELTMRNQNLRSILEPYDFLIPSTHVDNLDKRIIDLFKKIKLIPIDRSIHKSIGTDYSCVKNFYKQWKRETENNISISKAIDNLETLSASLEERVKKIELRDGHIISEFTNFETCIIKPFIRSRKHGNSSAHRKFSENFLSYYQAFIVSINEMTDLQFALVYLNIMGNNTIVRGSNLGKSFMNVFGEAVRDKTLEERMEMYSFLENIACDYDYEKPTIATLRASLKIEDLEDMPPELVFSMMGNEGTYGLSKVKNPVYSTKILEKYRKS